MWIHRIGHKSIDKQTRLIFGKHSFLHKINDMNYFTADWHLGDPRSGIDGAPNLLNRPFHSQEAHDNAILDSLAAAGFEDGDTLFHLGDVIFEINDRIVNGLKKLRSTYPNSFFVLILGNYDTQEKMSVLTLLFNIVKESYYLDEQEWTLLHYPSFASAWDSDALVGHIHGLWKVNKSPMTGKHLINVGVDAWHFKAVSEQQIAACFHACKNYYDEDVFL